MQERWGEHLQIVMVMGAGKAGNCGRKAEKLVAGLAG